MAWRHNSLHPPVNGHAFAGGSSRRQAVELVSRGTVGAEPGAYVIDLIARDRTVMASAPLVDLSIDPPLGKMPRRVSFPDGTMYETSDHEGFATITGTDRWHDLHRWEAFRPRLIGIVLASVFAGFLVWRYGLDVLVSGAIALTPQPIIDQIDRGSIETIDLAVANETKLSEQQRDRAHAVFKRLSSALPEETREDFNFNLIFRDTPRLGPNAAALPGGTILVTDQFMRTFADDDVLAAVLGHEIGHVVEQHGLRQMYRSLGTFVLITMVAGDPGPILNDVLLEGNALLSLSYSRDHERAADQYGLRLTRDAGYDPAALKTFFERISKSFGDNKSWTSSHPSNAERIEAIDAFLAEES